MATLKNLIYLPDKKIVVTPRLVTPQAGTSLESVVFALAVSCCDTRPQTPDVDGYQHDRGVKGVASGTRPAVHWILLRRLLRLNEPQSPSRKLQSSDFYLFISLGGHRGCVNKEVEGLKRKHGRDDGGPKLDLLCLR